MTFATVLWMILAGHCGWCLRTLHIPPPAAHAPVPEVTGWQAEVGEVVVTNIDALRFDLKLVGDEFIVRRELIIDKPNEPTIFIILCNKSVDALREATR